MEELLILNEDDFHILPSHRSIAQIIVGTVVRSSSPRHSLESLNAALLKDQFVFQNNQSLNSAAAPAAAADDNENVFF